MMVKPISVSYYQKIHNKNYASVLVCKNQTRSNLKDSKAKINFTGIYQTPNLIPVPFIEQYVNFNCIQNALNENPNIALILKYNGLEPKISLKNIDEKLKLHLFRTYLYAKEIANSSNFDSKSQDILYKASLLHDIGKALIPESIIQKPSKLTKKEKEIVDLHSLLSYEILKTTDVDFDVMEAVRLHHTPIYEKNGNIISHILSVADVYSALREERIYKAPMSNHEAFEIMLNMSQLSQDYVDILQHHQE